MIPGLIEESVQWIQHSGFFGDISREEAAAEHNQQWMDSFVSSNRHEIEWYRCNARDRVLNVIKQMLVALDEVTVESSERHYIRNSAAWAIVVGATKTKQMFPRTWAPEEGVVFEE